MSVIAVVILNYNGKHYLEKFLPSVIKHSGDARIIVADNNSTDDSINFLKKHHPSVDLILLKENYGFAGGYNQALEQVEADYFAIINSDVEVTPNWLSPLFSFLEKNTEYAACQPKILDFNKRDHFEYAGACGGFIDQLGYPYCRGRVFDSLEKDEGQYDQESDIFWATGACLFIRANLFKEIGGFDDDFFAHMEEIDLCWRLKNQGHKLRSIPSSTVYHVGGGTLSKINSFKTFLNFRNGLFLLLKNQSAGKLLWVLPVRIGLDWVAAFMYLIKGMGKHALAVLKAHLAFLGSFRTMMKKRTSARNCKMKVFSVVIGYFIGGKKRYSSYQ